MPKKPPRNSFYFYMLDFKEKQKRKGINYANMAEVADAAGPAWKLEPPNVRAKFEAEAKVEKQRNNVPEKKYTSQGVPLSEVANAHRMQLEAANAELKDIKDFVTAKSVNIEILLDEEMYILDVNSYCKAGDMYLIGEIALLRFSLRDGIRDCYHQMVNPGSAPVGYAYDVKMGAQEFGLPMPGEGPRTSSAQLLALIIDYLRQRRPHGALPPLYTSMEKVPQVTDFIQQLCQRAAEDEDIFRVYHLHLLFHWLVKAVSAPGEEFPRDTMALSQLKKDAFKYTPRLGCKHHEDGDMSTECALARAKRWAYTILDMTCARAGLPAVPGKHVPGEFDVDGIISFRESHAPPANAWGTNNANSTLQSNTTADSTLDTSRASHNNTVTNTTVSTVDSANKVQVPAKRVHVPLRALKVDFAHQMRAAPPILDDSEFPAFPTPVRGRGRGALPGVPGGLDGSFGKMKM